MNETLTGGQTVGQGVAVAPATSATAGATPAPRPGTPAGPEGTPPPQRLGGQGWPGEAGQGVALAPATPNVAGARVATVATPQTGSAVPRRVARLLAAAALIGMIPVTLIGFGASYSTLAAMAEAAGFAPWLAPWIPLGIDGAIVGFLALDLYLTARRIPWPLLRFAAHAMTAATVVINAAGGTVVKATADTLQVTGPVRVLWHGLMPVLFIVGVEGARRLIVHAARLEDGTASDRIPLHRWALAPVRTSRLYRRMRLAVVRSYPEMVEREQALEGYRVWLTQELGGDLSKASEVQLLPMTMAPRGYTVEEALALPAKWRAEAEDRARAEAERERVEAERQRRQAKEDRLRALADDADIEVATHEQAARMGTAAANAEARTAEAESAAQAAKVAAEHRRAAAERQSQAEAEALESADVAAARRKAAEDLAAAERAEAEAQRQRAAADKARAETARWVAETTRQAEAEQRAEAAKQAATKAAAEAEKEAAAARHETAMIEARTQQAEDYARLSPRERSERQVARMILATGGDPEAVPLTTIMETLNIKQTAAGDIRKAAVLLLDAGYRPTELETLLDARP